MKKSDFILKLAHGRSNQNDHKDVSFKFSPEIYTLVCYMTPTDRYSKYQGDLYLVLLQYFLTSSKNKIIIKFEFLSEQMRLSTEKEKGNGEVRGLQESTSF